MTDFSSRISNQEDLEDKKGREESKICKKKKSRFFETYISKILKRVAPDSGITANAKQQLNSAICTIARKISQSVFSLTITSDKKTSSAKELDSAIRLLFPIQISDILVQSGENSVQKFTNGNHRGSRQDKAGIIFPPSVAEKFLRNFGYSKIMVTKTAPIFLASVLEYLTEDVLKKSNQICQDHNRVRITIRELELAVRKDDILDKIFIAFSLSFLGGGVIPKIHESLLVKKPKKKKKVLPQADQSFVDNKKTHRFRPGTVSLREIRKYQKTSNCLTFAKFPFRRFARSIVNRYNPGMKMSKEVFVVLQYYIEQFIVDFLRDANSAAIHSGRVKLMPGDISFISSLRKYPSLDVEKYKTVEVAKNTETEEINETDEIIQHEDVGDDPIGDDLIGDDLIGDDIGDDPDEDSQGIQD